MDSRWPINRLILGTVAVLSVSGLLAAAYLQPDGRPEVAALSSPTPFQLGGGAPLARATAAGGVNVLIQDGDQQLVLHSSALSVGQALAQSGITLSAGDHVQPGPAEALRPGMTIVINRGAAYMVLADGRSLQVRGHSPTVRLVLAAAGLTLSPLDYSRPDLDSSLLPGGTVELVRVTESIYEEDEIIPFETVWQPADHLELDGSALLAAGQPGILRHRFRLRYENGGLVSQSADGEWLARAPVNETYGYGTRIVTRVLETPAGSYEYWRVVRMRVTSYTALSSGKPPDHPAYGITASGVRAGTGIVAVDKSIVPFRSWVYVPGYGVGFAGDTGGGILGRWIDLGYNRFDFVPWSGYVDVYYLAPAPPADEINYRLPEALP